MTCDICNDDQFIARMLKGKMICVRCLSALRASEAQPVQPVSPSASCSAQERSGGEDNGAETASRSAQSSGLRATEKVFAVITNRNGLEETICHTMREAIATIEYGFFTGATKAGLFLQFQEPSNAHPAEGERATARNSDYTGPHSG